MKSFRQVVGSMAYGILIDHDIRDWKTLYDLIMSRGLKESGGTIVFADDGRARCRNFARRLLPAVREIYYRNRWADVLMESKGAPNPNAVEQFCADLARLPGLTIPSLPPLNIRNNGFVTVNIIRSRQWTRKDCPVAILTA